MEEVETEDVVFPYVIMDCGIELTPSVRGGIGADDRHRQDIDICESSMIQGYVGDIAYLGDCYSTDIIGYSAESGEPTGG